MSIDRSKLDTLSAAEQELLAKLSEIRAEKQQIEAQEREFLSQWDDALKEDEARRLLQTPMTVTITKVAEGMVFTSSPYRPDLTDYWRSVPGRMWKGYAPADSSGINAIPIGNWAGCETGLLNLPLITIEWKEDTKAKYEWWLTAPPWNVSYNSDKNQYIVKPGPVTNRWTHIHNIPGAAWDYEDAEYSVPFSEGWRIIESLANIEGVVYTEEAQALLTKQVADRDKINLIAIQTTTDFDVELAQGKLRPFQRIGVEFAAATGGRFILADGTGLGKTLQYLAYALHMRKTKPDFQSIIVCKANLIPNVRHEIEARTGLEVYQCFTGKPNAYDTQKIILERTPFILISYDTLGLYWTTLDGKEVDKKNLTPQELAASEQVFPWVEVFGLAEPDLLVLDEAHQIKNPSANRTKAVMRMDKVPHVIPVTASPILNRAAELWPMLKIVAPELFKSQQQFLNTYTDGKRPTNTKMLHELLAPMFLRRRKADVIKDLPPINRIHRFYDLSPEGEKAYKLAQAGVYEQLATYDPAGIGGKQMSIMSVLAAITRLKQICAADMVGHTVELGNELVDEANGTGDKVLIFTQFLAVAADIAKRLGPSAICTVNGHGTDAKSLRADERHHLFESIRNDPKIRFVVTTEASKEGHNLEFCKWVIFNDPFWTPAAHYQAEGRAYGRLSDPHPIDSYYQVADTQIIRWIFELLDSKLADFNEVVEGIESNRDVMGSIGSELVKKMREAMWSQS